MRSHHQACTHACLTLCLFTGSFTGTPGPWVAPGLAGNDIRIIRVTYPYHVQSADTNRRYSVHYCACC